MTEDLNCPHCARLRWAEEEAAAYLRQVAAEPVARAVSHLTINPVTVVDVVITDPEIL